MRKVLFLLITQSSTFTINSNGHCNKAGKTIDYTPQPPINLFRK